MNKYRYNKNTYRRNMDKIYNEIKIKIEENRIYLNEPMSKHTTFRIGGNADVFVKVNDVEELKHIFKIANKEKVAVTVIGNGSNLLVKDDGIRGIVVKLDFKNIKFLEGDKVEVGSGVLLSKIANEAYKKSLSGLEFASGIPGTVGGAIKMNAGAYGGELKDIVVSTRYLDKALELHEINNEEHDFKYRHSKFNKNNGEIIISTILQLKEENKEVIKAKMDENNKSRREKQPIDFPSGGSTFKRGDGFITAKIIDECGLKGLNIGDAYISEKHAGFIVNKGKATAKDVLELIEIVKTKVKEKYNVDIELEIEILGED